MPGGAHENMRGWSPEEDGLLLDLIQVHSRTTPLDSPKPPDLGLPAGAWFFPWGQTTYCRPNRILPRSQKSGKRWKLIAEALVDHTSGHERTPAMVRNRYLRIERGRELTEQGKSKNRCGQCGQLKRGHVCQAPRALVSTSYQAQEAQHEVHRLRVGDPFGAGINIGSAGGLNIGSGGGLNMVAIGQHVAPDDNTYGVPTVMVTAAPQVHHWGVGGVAPPNANPGAAAPAAAPASAAFGPPMLRPQESMDLLAFVAEHATQPTQPTQQTEVPSIDDDELPSMGLSGELPPAPAAPAPAGGGHFISAASTGGISLSFGGGGIGFGGMGGGTISFDVGGAGGRCAQPPYVGAGPYSSFGRASSGSFGLGVPALSTTPSLSGASPLPMAPGGLAAALSPAGMAAAGSLAAPVGVPSAFGGGGTYVDIGLQLQHDVQQLQLLQDIGLQLQHDVQQQQQQQQFVKSDVTPSAPSSSSEDVASLEVAYVCTGGVAAAKLQASSLPAAGSFKGELVGSTDTLSTSSNSSVSNVEV